MAKHKRFTSLQDVQSAQAGASRKTAGHLALGLWVVANNLDPANDTVKVRGEVSPNDTHYHPVDIGTTQNDDVLSVTTADFVQSDADNSVYVAYIQAHNVPVEHLRANLTSYTDSSTENDLSVTAYLFLGGWAGRGKSYNERTDTVPNY